MFLDGREREKKPEPLNPGGDTYHPWIRLSKKILFQVKAHDLRLLGYSAVTVWGDVRVVEVTYVGALPNYGETSNLVN